MIYTIIIGMICSFIVFVSFKIQVENRKNTLNRLKSINQSADIKIGR
ncbi:hypothetical protein [Clostridium acetireducens]|nr:hypothetical protein [Clostridium acetireducens]